MKFIKDYRLDERLDINEEDNLDMPDEDNPEFTKRELINLEQALDDISEPMSLEEYNKLFC